MKIDKQKIVFKKKPTIIEPKMNSSQANEDFESKLKLSEEKQA